MNYILTCQYCGFRETKTFYTKAMMKDLRCSKCNDPNLKIVDESTEKIDTYVGCPEFPTTSKDSKEDDYGF